MPDVSVVVTSPEVDAVSVGAELHAASKSTVAATGNRESFIDDSQERFGPAKVSDYWPTLEQGSWIEPPLCL
jgi:hypothetical protein